MMQVSFSQKEVSKSAWCLKCMLELKKWSKEKRWVEIRAEYQDFNMFP